MSPFEAHVTARLFSFLPFREQPTNEPYQSPGRLTTFAPISIVTRGRLCRDRALARQAEPRLYIVTAELGGAQLDDLQCGLDGEGDLACRAAGRADLARWAFSAADEAQPQAAGF